jgi:acyl-CoA thioester hydrolase
MDRADAAGMAALYAGSANTWECDEMGHLNVRFYVARAQEGLGLLAMRLGIADAFGRQARATLAPLDQHIRFLKEVRPGQPLRMVGCITDIEETQAWVYQELRHGDGTPAAAIHTRVAHVEAQGMRAFPWSQRTLEAAKGVMGALPAHARPRSIRMEQEPLSGVSLASAERLNAHRIGASLVSPDQTDAFGRMRSEFFIGRISDAVPNLLADWREAVANAASGADGKVRQAGAAVLEYRLVYRAWPRAGSGVLVYSGVLSMEGKSHRLAHWLIDPESGQAWGTAEAVAITFDLKTRKAITPSPADAAALERLKVAGMAV